MWTPRLLSSALLLSLMCSASSWPVRKDFLEVSYASGQNCTLTCTAEHKPGVQYSAVRWYKAESNSDQRSGLLARNLPNGTTRWYKDVPKEIELLGESHDLFLPNATCGDGGVYLCYLAAPVGHQNQEGKVRLTLKDCPAASKEFPITQETTLLADTVMVIFASTLLGLALLISFLSYKCLKNTVKGRTQTAKKEILLNAPLKPLDKKDLMLIFTLGPKTSKMKHICV